MKFRSKTKIEPAGFQLTPMIDCVSLLLCFSLVTQIQSRWETEMDITLPTADSSTPIRRLPGEIILNVREDGTVVFNRRALNDDELYSLLGEVATLFRDQPVLIRADGGTRYANVVKVLDACRKTRIWNISFATGIPEKSP